MKVQLNELEEYTKNLVSSLKKDGGDNGAIVLALVGDLGAGKTTLTQYISKELGVTEAVTSPTFVIEKVYELVDQAPFTKLIHIDAYRLDSSKELENLGWHAITRDNNNIIIVEWANNVEDILPANTKTLHMSYIGEESREIIPTGHKHE